MDDSSKSLLVDAHVHIYDCFDLSVFIGSALSNFSLAASRNKEEGPFVPLLFLTESRTERWFRRLYEEVKKRGNFGDDVEGCELSHTEEATSLRVTKKNHPPLFLVSGRQIVTEEKLEVLALATGNEFADGRPLEDTVESVIEDGAIPVIPWGFGKWEGRRGRILWNYLEKAPNSSVFLGDNAARPFFLPYPRHFSLGKEKGIRILPGSDPLPFRSEARRAGSFGFFLHGSIDPGRPGESMKKHLRNPETDPKPYGALEGPVRFAVNQCAMQLRKFLG